MSRSQSIAQTVLHLPDLVVDPDWLAAHLDHPGLRLVDVRTAENYAEGHIPGAVRLALESLATQIDGVPGMLLPPDVYAERLGSLGVDADSVVVLYDDHWGMPAARVLWSLARYGHTNAAILNGGWDRWAAESRPATTEVPVVQPAHFVPRPADDEIAARPWLLGRLNDGDVVIIDTRTPGEFGQGHLPGALNWDWMNGVPVETWDTLRPAEELRAELADLGITPDKEVITYCRSGARAAHTYVLLRRLGFPRVRNYDGSWLEWSHYLNA